MNKQGITIFLTFSGNANNAMQFYALVLPGAKIMDIVRYGSDNPVAKKGDENKVLHGSLSFREQEIMFMDMVGDYPVPDFSWATSIFLSCIDEKEFDTIFNKLSLGGRVMMGPEPVLKLRKVAWVTDKFGVTWQLVWE